MAGHLKTISKHIKAVGNIQQMTKSLKMVSQSKLKRAADELRETRQIGEGVTVFYERAKVRLDPDELVPLAVLVAITSDKGMCGSANAGIIRHIRRDLEYASPEKVKVICVGDKARAGLNRDHGDFISFSATYGRKPPTFIDAAKLAQVILTGGHEFTSGQLIYNRMEGKMAFKVDSMPIYNLSSIFAAENISLYDELGHNTALCYLEFSLTALIFKAMNHGATSEHLARLNAMESASRNAGNMGKDLSQMYNRLRQKTVTTELIEIVSGAECLKKSGR